MDLVQRITAIISPSLEAMGYAIVQVKLAEGSRRKALSIMAERADGVAMGFDDCVEISRTVGALLEVEDPITTAYDLEVCSPGSDRPLTRLEDYTRFMGEEIKLETLIPQDGRKRFRGRIAGVEGEELTLDTPEGRFTVRFGMVRMARLQPPAAPRPVYQAKPGKPKSQPNVKKKRTTA